MGGFSFSLFAMAGVAFRKAGASSLKEYTVGRRQQVRQRRKGLKGIEKEPGK
jgi:hypothetical protein